MGTVGFRIEVDKKAAESMIERYKAERSKYVREQFIQVGKRFAENAWANADFMNHTYDLRSSIGFVVVENGRIVHDEFRVISTGALGSATGLKVANEAIAELDGDDEFALIGVAGMSYAIYVESKGKDVITGSAGLAKSMLERAMR